MTKKYVTHRDYHGALAAHDKPDWAVYEECDRHRIGCSHNDHTPIAVFAKRGDAQAFARWKNGRKP